MLMVGLLWYCGTRFVSSPWAGSSCPQWDQLLFLLGDGCEEGKERTWDQGENRRSRAARDRTELGPVTEM